jgi:RHS repeat-associated protein
MSCLLLALLLPQDVSAHICGPPTRTVRPGALFYHYILADIFETEPSDYQLVSVSNPNVVAVYPTSAFSAYYYGEFELEALAEGQADVTFFWAYAPYAATGYCTLHVIVANNAVLTAANYSQSALTDDPVNAFTGEQILNEPPDLDLGGPMPLQFRRYYASYLDANLLLRSSLGINWSHNFDTRLVRVSNRVDVVTYQGLEAQFQENSGVWQPLNSQARPFQLVDSVINGTTNLILGDRRENRVYTFDAFGELVSIADGKGNVHTLTYYNNSLVQVSDGQGRVLTFSSAGFQLLNSVADGTRTIQFSYSADPANPELLAVTNAMGGTTSYAYDPANSNPALLISKTLPQGNTPITQAYDALGRVIQQVAADPHTNKFFYGSGSTTVTNPLGLTRSYSHNANGQLTAYTDEAAQSVAITVNTNGQRSLVTDRAGNGIGLAYDPTNGKTAAITNADGTVTRFAYTNHVVSSITFYDLSQVSYPDGSTENYVYDGAGNVITRIDRGGNEWDYTYNNHGQVLIERNPRGGVTVLTYKSDGTLDSSRDSDLGTTVYWYDSLRRLTKIVHPDGAGSFAALDANDRVVSVTDERTNTFTYLYDANDNLTNIIDPNSNSLLFQYDIMNREVKRTDRLGNSESLTYDPLGRILNITNREGHVITIGYDARNRPVSITDAAGKIWSAGINSEGLGTSTTNPLLQATFNRLDATGYVVGHTNPLGQVSSLARDAMHQVTQFVDELNDTNRFGLDSRGLVTSETRPRIGSVALRWNKLGGVEQLTDYNGADWSFGYTAMNRPLSFNDPLNWYTWTTYNPRGQPVMTTFADGTTRSNSFDAAGNPTDTHFSDGTDYMYNFDPLNHLAGGTGFILGRDAEGRITNTESWGVNFGAGYSPGGLLTHVSYNNGAFNIFYGYDDRERVNLVSNAETHAWVKLNYNDANDVTNLTRANGVNAIYTRGMLGEITRIQDGPFLDLQYRYNAAGWMTQLTGKWPLDPAGFALTRSLNLKYDYNLGSQIRNPGYGYDWQGRLEYTPTRTFQYNAASQLTIADGPLLTYNGLGDVMTRAAAGTTTWNYYNYALGPNKLAGEFNQTSGQYMRYYAWIPNGPLVFSYNPLSNSVSYYHTDRDGSTLALTDPTGAVKATYAYAVTGQMFGQTGNDTQPFTWLGTRGVRYDSTADLYQFRSRFYSAELGSFLTPNLAWPRLSDPQGLGSPYSLANNNPLSLFNEDGLGAMPLGNTFPGRSSFVRNIEEPPRNLVRIQTPQSFEVGNFLQAYDSQQTRNRSSFTSQYRLVRLASGPESIQDYWSGGGGCCCCCDCCCCDCCCCCCCCCCGGGPVVRISYTSFARGGLFSPVRATTYAQFLNLTEAYRKFRYLNLVPRIQLPLSPLIPGLQRPAEANSAAGDRHEQNLFRNFQLPIRSQF